MADTATSKRIASVLGPVLLAVTTSEFLNLGIWNENHPPLTYLNGMILFATGFAILRFHHRWRPLWTASVTLVGALMTAGGAYRLYFPTAPQADPTPATYAFVIFLGLMGLIMTIGAYRPRGPV